MLHSLILNSCTGRLTLPFLELPLKIFSADPRIMFYIGAPGVMFRCKDFTCSLTDTFNLIIPVDLALYRAGAVAPVGLVVPTKYISFVKTINAKWSADTPVSDIFQFRNPEDAGRMQAYVKGLPPNDVPRIIKSFAITKKTKRQWPLK